MMYWLKRWIIWIYRWRHCRGFGVQSPSDYSFIRYVINEHYPYYAYADILEQLGDIGQLQRKKAELLFRIANWKQAQSVALLTNDEVYSVYIHHGCRKTVIRSHYESHDSFMVISAYAKDDCLDMLNNMRHGSLMVIDDLDNKKARHLWANIIADNKATITFDLYYVGIVLTIAKRYKINYKVNF